MSMPDPGAELHLAQLDYYFTISEVVLGGGLVKFAVPDPVHFTFGFETGQAVNPDGSVTVTWDYTQGGTFDRAQREAGLAVAISDITAPIASLLGVAQAVIDAAVTVKRVWTYAPNVQGPGVSSGRIVTTDFMPYPPRVTGADTAHAAESSGVVIQ